jgi:hypothetical protein
MKLTNCRYCGKLYQSLGGKICPDCRKKDQEQYQAVKEYLQEFPTAPVYKVSSETNVPVKRIYQYVREGKLAILTPDSEFCVECAKCGVKISAGLLCPACEREYNSKKGKLPQKSNSDKVHIKSDYEYNSTKKD